MSTHHLIDPELLPLLDLLPNSEFSAERLPLIRQLSEARFKFLGEPALPAEVKVIEGPDGPLEVCWFDPAPGSKDRPAPLRIHGGGMILVRQS